jgi:hypothetical protein
MKIGAGTLCFLLANIAETIRVLVAESAKLPLQMRIAEKLFDIERLLGSNGKGQSLELKAAALGLEPRTS